MNSYINKTGLYFNAPKKHTSKKVTLHINRWVEPSLHRKLFLLVAPLRKTKRTADLMKVYRGTRGRAMMIEDPQELPYSITCTSRPNIFLYTFSLSLCRRNQAVYMTTLILSEVIIANDGKKISLLSCRSNQFS